MARSRVPFRARGCVLEETWNRRSADMQTASICGALMATAALAGCLIDAPKFCTRGPVRRPFLVGQSLGFCRLFAGPKLSHFLPSAYTTQFLRAVTVKKGLHWPRLSAIIPNLSAGGSHPDCRAILIQIVALQTSAR